jgi:hypothetical protein
MFQAVLRPLDDALSLSLSLSLSRALCPCLSCALSLFDSLALTLNTDGQATERGMLQAILRHLQDVLCRLCGNLRRLLLSRVLSLSRTPSRACMLSLVPRVLWHASLSLMIFVSRSLSSLPF